MQEIRNKVSPTNIKLG